MDTRLAKRGLMATGFMSIFGVLVFSRLFANQALTEADPVVMSNFGLVMIMVWGMAYPSAAIVNIGAQQSDITKLKVDALNWLPRLRWTQSHL